MNRALDPEGGGGGREWVDRAYQECVDVMC